MSPHSFFCFRIEFHINSGPHRAGIILAALTKLIGITGLARSGKDILANYLVNDHGFIKPSLAAPIRAFMADITSFPVPAMQDSSEKEQPFDWLDRQTPRHLMRSWVPSVVAT